MGVEVKDAVKLAVKLGEAVGVKEEVVLEVIVAVGGCVPAFVGLAVGVPETRKVLIGVGELVGSEVCPVVGWLVKVEFWVALETGVLVG
jgi:hypothetical protein